MIKRYLQKWLEIDDKYLLAVNALRLDLQRQIDALKLYKRDKPQNCKLPVRAAVKRKPAKGRK